MGESGFIYDDEVIFFFPGETDVQITPANGAAPYRATVQVDWWQGSLNGKPIVTIPLEER